MKELNLGPTGLFCGALRPSRSGRRGEAAAREAEEMGWSSLWIAGGFDSEDAISDMRSLLAATVSVNVCIGVMSIWATDPARLATAYSELTDEFGPRFVLAIGVSHPESVVAIRSNAGESGDDLGWQPPVRAMNGYLDQLQQHLGGAADRVMIGTLGPQMTRLAGRRTAGAYPYFVPVAHTRAARAELGHGPLLAVEQAVLLDATADDVRSLGRKHMEYYLSLGNYRKNLDRFGFGAADLANGGSDRLIEAMIAVGGLEEALARIDDHRQAGADHVVLQVIPSQDGEDFPASSWRQLAAGLHLQLRH